MACNCTALYLVPTDPKALYTTFNDSSIHAYIHPLEMESYIVATAALELTDNNAVE